MATKEEREVEIQKRLYEKEKFYVRVRGNRHYVTPPGGVEVACSRCNECGGAYVVREHCTNCGAPR